MAKNQVIAGDYNGYLVICTLGTASIAPPWKKAVVSLTSDTVESYETVTEDVRKSAASGIARGAVGGLLLGPVGLLAGVSAKTKGTYQVAIQFKDGKRSLLEVDKKAYQAIVKRCF